ncbi:ABC transporter ATP-binding protein [Immundisolibacter sp.]|uniref:ABC transporter ATP-binding protein n=1 Tax=Immundisolibacter sp. TaxID=1934948 RepID=UPI002B13D771|nr:ABC transporter ATP-binding protein [Immundisolibacter sp.]MEA3220452.1 Lipoprotein-releasing system ATP-binding protein LolD [Immundisolibacter sp.]
MSNQAPVLEARGLGKTYLDAGGALTVLHDVDLTVRAGESVAVMGASGAGKSTLLHLLGGLDAASRGEVWVDGRSLTGLGERERSRMRNQSLGFIYQFHHLLDEFTARENIAMPLLIGGQAPAQAGAAADAMLERLGLAARGHHKPGQLSGGERQRVAIGRALVTRPRCILADEPTGNLDPHTAEQVFRQLVEVCSERGGGLVVVTHNPQLARLLDRRLMLADGRLADSD